jgi:hypothetical protein
MQYVLLIYQSESTIPDRSSAPYREMLAEYTAFNQHMRERGNLIKGDALHSVTTATTVRVRDDQVLHTDGPFAETKEQLGGFYLIEARDLDEALDLARRIPAARVGSIEVRPVFTAAELGMPTSDKA